jgi:phosphoglucomutase
MGLLAAEILANTGRDPGALYGDLTRSFGEPVYDRIDTPATLETKERLKKLSPKDVGIKTLAGETIEAISTSASNGEPIGGIKVTSKNGWFAARPSGTENIAKLYAESFLGRDHLARIIEEAKAIVSSRQA